MDYEELDVIVMFTVNEIRKCVDVTIVDDVIPEQAENFFYTLERTPGLDPRISLTPVNGEIVIDDDG